MIIVMLFVFGLIFGSFVNALVWRLRQQELASKKSKVHKVSKDVIAKLLSTFHFQPSTKSDDLSIVHGRSMCPECRHELSALDLIPVFSWLYLRGKCRYCHKPILIQYPLVELLTAGLFVASYIWWPSTVSSLLSTMQFATWLLIIVGLVALTVYDLRWMLLPNRLIYPISGLAVAFGLINVSLADSPATALINTALAVLVGGGIFYVIFQVSNGKWIGGGDVRLGWMLGLLVATPAKAVLTIFLASVIGSLVSLPLLARGKLKIKASIPFGPFLITGAIITVLFGADILNWYTNTLIGY